MKTNSTLRTGEANDNAQAIWNVSYGELRRSITSELERQNGPFVSTALNMRATAENAHCEPSLTTILRIVGCHQKIKTIIAYFESLSKRKASAAPAIIAPAVAPSDLRSSFDTTCTPSFLIN